MPVSYTSAAAFVKGLFCCLLRSSWSTECRLRIRMFLLHARWWFSKLLIEYDDFTFSSYFLSLIFDSDIVFSSR